MCNIIITLLSLVLTWSSFVYVDKRLTTDGEYQASLYYVGKETTNIHIVTKMKNGEFISHTYLNSPSLGEIATFLSKGYFIDDDTDGTYSFRYNMEETNTPTLLRREGANLYLSMVARVGFSQEETIKMIYHDKKFSIFDMNRNNNIIMYVKKF